MKHIDPTKRQHGTIMPMLSCFNVNYSQIFCLSAMGLSLCYATASAADMQAMHTPIPQSSSFADAGACAYEHVLSAVNYRFYHEVLHVPGLPLVRIKEMANITATREEPAATKLNVRRQFCQATAIMNDGSSYPAYYMVEFGQGFTGVGGYNVEFCVEGFDKWRI
uniref:hypothetical protein n=1 Tax=uncultured Bartonella sp. TaxID=104108 RepID=UPI00261FF5CD